MSPSETGSCELFLAHLRDVVCRSDTALYEWVVQWFAHIVQKPEKLSGTALVLRGVQASGKSIIGQVIREILGPALYTKISRSDEFTGRFNPHLSGRLFVQVEEGFWAGDRSAESTLKDLITADTINIETKFGPRVSVPNYARYFFTSNSTWVVPAAAGERRFAVLEVSSERANDHPYFDALLNQMFANGGCARLLHHLLHEVTVDWLSIRRPPQTDALRDQQIEGLPSQERWLLDLFTEGALPGDTRGDGVTPKDALFNLSYKPAMRDGGQRFRVDKKGLHDALSRFLGDALGEPRLGGTSRVRCFRFPPLAECRRRFAKTLSTQPPWDYQETWRPEGVELEALLGAISAEPLEPANSPAARNNGSTENRENGDS